VLADAGVHFHFFIIGVEVQVRLAVPHGLFGNRDGGSKQWRLKTFKAFT
jgi:hypothetical protein